MQQGLEAQSTDKNAKTCESATNLYTLALKILDSVIISTLHADASTMTPTELKKRAGCQAVCQALLQGWSSQLLSNTIGNKNATLAYIKPLLEKTGLVEALVAATPPSKLGDVLLAATCCMGGMAGDGVAVEVLVSVFESVLSTVVDGDGLDDASTVHYLSALWTALHALVNVKPDTYSVDGLSFANSVHGEQPAWLRLVGASKDRAQVDVRGKGSGKGGGTTLFYSRLILATCEMATSGIGSECSSESSLMALLTRANDALETSMASHVRAHFMNEDAAEALATAKGYLRIVEELTVGPTASHLSHAYALRIVSRLGSKTAQAITAAEQRARAIKASQGYIPPFADALEKLGGGFSGSKDSGGGGGDRWTAMKALTMEVYGLDEASLLAQYE